MSDLEITSSVNRAATLMITDADEDGECEVIIDCFGYDAYTARIYIDSNRAIDIITHLTKVYGLNK